METKKIIAKEGRIIEVVIDESLSRFSNKGHFQEKLDKANEILTKYGLPGKMSERPVSTIRSEILNFTFQINKLREELRKNNKPLTSNRELMRMRGKRRRRMAYLKKNNPKQYNILAKKIRLGK